MNLFENILKKATNENMITHILSYDLKNASAKIYLDLSEKLEKDFCWKKTHLQSQTVWELSTQVECDTIMQTIFYICWSDKCQVNLYKVQVLEKKTHPIVLPIVKKPSIVLPKTKRI